MIRGLWGPLGRKCHRFGVSRKCPNDLFLRFAVNQMSSRQFMSDKKSVYFTFNASNGVPQGWTLRLNPFVYNQNQWNVLKFSWKVTTMTMLFILINVKWEIWRSEENWEYGHKISKGYPFKDPLYTHEYMYVIFQQSKI